jgi:VanZ family protein
MYLFYVVLPLALAIIIYILFRSNPPALLAAVISLVSTTYQPILLEADFDWFIYNVPDALWAFSFMSFLMITSRLDGPIIRGMYLMLGLTIMILLEVTQGIYLPGTYDYLDVVAVALGAGLSYLSMMRFIN